MEIQNSFTLALTDSDSDASRLQRLTRDLTAALDRQRDVRAQIPEHGIPAGARGDPVTIGAIVLTLIGSGGVVKSLMDVLKAWIERKPTLKIEITRADGSKATISAESLAPAQMASLQEFFGH